MLRRLALPLLLSLGCLALPACDSVEAQRDFEAQAFLPPNGIGNDDWQIGPFFQTAAFFLETPSPNPVPVGEFVQFTLRVQEPAAFSNGLTLETSFDFDGDGRLEAGEAGIVLAFERYEGEVQFFVDFDPRRSTVASNRVFPSGATYRLRIFAGRELLTYGDIRLGN